jgi:hypothetical protein
MATLRPLFFGGAGAVVVPSPLPVGGGSVLVDGIRATLSDQRLNAQLGEDRLTAILSDQRLNATICNVVPGPFQQPYDWTMTVGNSFDNHGLVGTGIPGSINPTTFEGRTINLLFTFPPSRIRMTNTDAVQFASWNVINVKWDGAPVAAGYNLAWTGTIYEVQPGSSVVTALNDFLRDTIGVGNDVGVHLEGVS